MAQNTIGVKLYIKCTTTELAQAYTGGDMSAFGLVKSEEGSNLAQIPNLMEISELAFNARNASSGFDKIEVTTLADNKHMYIDGLIADSGDDTASELTFKFLYDKALFKTLSGLTSAKDAAGNDKFDFVVEIPGGSIFKIHAYVKSAVLDSVAVGSALTMNFTISVDTMTLAESL